MNKTQKNFKKQMKEIEQDLLDKAKNDEGLFNNNLYKDKFYGNPTSRSKGSISFIAVIGIIAAILFFTNPNKSDFNEWAKSQLLSQTKSDMERGLIELLGGTVSEAVTVRKDYILFSIYESRISGNNNQKILGIFKIFIPL